METNNPELQTHYSKKLEILEKEIFCKFQNLEESLNLKKMLFDDILLEIYNDKVDYSQTENFFMNKFEKKIDLILESILKKLDVCLREYTKSMEKTIYEEKLFSKKIEMLCNNLTIN